MTTLYHDVAKTILESLIDEATWKNNKEVFGYGVFVHIKNNKTYLSSFVDKRISRSKALLIIEKEYRYRRKTKD